jgi:hypothetical protein
MAEHRVSKSIFFQQKKPKVIAQVFKKSVHFLVFLVVKVT